MSQYFLALKVITLDALMRRVTAQPTITHKRMTNNRAIKKRAEKVDSTKTFCNDHSKLYYLIIWVYYDTLSPFEHPQIYLCFLLFLKVVQSICDTRQKLQGNRYETFAFDMALADKMF